jgi:orotidine-5'-phosphate decarboxylase
VKQAEATRLQPRDRLIVALDLPSVEAAQAMVSRLGDAASFYKIGYQLAFAGGLAYAQTLAGAGKRVFLDLKLHDIGNTVAQGVKSVSRLGASFLTVHGYPHGIRQQTHLASIRCKLWKVALYKPPLANSILSLL